MHTGLTSTTSEGWRLSAWLSAYSPSGAERYPGHPHQSSRRKASGDRSTSCSLSPGPLQASSEAAAASTASAKRGSLRSSCPTRQYMPSNTDFRFVQAGSATKSSSVGSS